MSSITKSGISLSKKSLTKSRIPPVSSRNVVFYHKATLGQLSLDLLALSMPSEMPAQVQATVDEISGARLYHNKKNLSLISSSKGPLIQGLDYEVTSGTTISFKGPGFTSGTELDEIFVGTINSAPISDLIAASAKSVVKTYELAVGQNILNLGREYQVGANPNEDVGSVKIFVNGVLAHRDVDYAEVDAGSGYGTTVNFFAAPPSIPYQIAVDFGVMSITDNNAIGSIESLSGAVKKLADDLAVVAGTDADDYLSANPSEIERRAFGDWILKILEIEVSKVITQSSFLNQPSAFSGSANVTGALTASDGSGLYSYDSVTGVYTVLQSCQVNMSHTGLANGAVAAFVGLQVTSSAHGNIAIGDTTVSTDNAYGASSFSVSLQAGDTFYARVGTASCDGHLVTVNAIRHETSKIRDIIGV